MAEGLGLALPGNGTILAVSPERKEFVKQAARQLMKLIELDLKPRDIVTKDSIDNAFALDMAMGGSTNTVLHTLAIAHEAGIEYPISSVLMKSRLAYRILQKSLLLPTYHIEDVHNAGGVSAILNELFKKEGALHGEVHYRYR